ncbi:MAG: two-component system, OmpR family, phosphate regulon response regulator PhoB [Parcubacteria bacterium C7867-001]|nr:MAG: two-component system, OmpR family, phosphate regulon response regulator PhoB [Parcubacteria bacterium C7867-001]
MAHFFMAEDDPLMTRMYERAFRLNNHELTVAHDGEEALALLAKIDPKPSVILLDVMMPKKSGFDVLVAIKQDPALKDIPTLMLTNLAGKEDAAKALELGAQEYLVKSDYNPKQVIDKVTALVK